MAALVVLGSHAGSSPGALRIRARRWMCGLCDRRLGLIGGARAAVLEEQHDGDDHADERDKEWEELEEEHGSD